MINPWTIIIALGAFVIWRWIGAEKKRVAARAGRARTHSRPQPRAVELERDEDGVYRPRDD